MMCSAKRRVSGSKGWNAMVLRITTAGSVFSFT